MSTTLKIIPLILFVGIQAFAERAADIQPKTPKQGDTLVITYNPNSENAKFGEDAQVYAYITHTFENSGMKRLSRPMTLDEGVFRCEYVVPKDTAHISLYFVTMTGCDEKITPSTMIHHPDGAPVRHAYTGSLTSGDSADIPDLLAKERALYPNCISGYGLKWTVDGYHKPDQLQDIVRADMATFAELKETPDKLFAQSYGYMLLRQEDKSLACLERLAEAYPTHPLTHDAFSSYRYLTFSLKIKTDGFEAMKRLKRDLADRYPLSFLARSESLFLAHQPDATLAQVEAVCLPWIEEEPEHPSPYLSMAKACSRFKPELTNQYLDKAINLLLAGKLRLISDPYGNMTQRRLAMALELDIETAQTQGDAKRALSSLMILQALTKNGNPEHALSEGNLWRDSGFHELAGNAYVRAWHKKLPAARDALEGLYKYEHKNLEGFPKHLAELMNEPEPGTEPAPDFQVVDMEGNSYKLSELRGKVVVLNFWFIGCAPCRIEIPALNKLVQEYKAGDVVFIAFARDNEASLKRFLKKSPFDYQIIPADREVGRAYKVAAWPTHVIIDQKGRIAKYKTGGNENVNEELKVQIDRLLAP